ncbi:hypothetical protein A2W49_01415 [Candidatus Roizmanbacteria bacterium RIFCSPHIGHO2_12_41_18]|nr:MAG: hypothetical protein A2W49_01415 [Candidatus Roizmanbacteria bacterium RIFCSPHIGHO2_12_41_18]
MAAEGQESLPRRIINYTKLRIEKMKQHLRTADLNPHEGKLRASGMPDKDLQKRFPIPDHPPLHDDTIPDIQND